MELWVIKECIEWEKEFISGRSILIGYIILVVSSEDMGVIVFV